MRVIEFSLDSKSIDKAIIELKKFKDDLINAMGELVRALTMDGKEHAQLEILRLGAFDTGLLADTMVGDYDASTHTGVIYTKAYYAAFVEYGTGVKGAREPHPAPGGWVYDSNMHGDSGWVYYDDREERFRWTKGTEASPFMYNTYKYLTQIAQDMARQYFSNL